MQTGSSCLETDGETDEERGREEGKGTQKLKREGDVVIPSRYPIFRGDFGTVQHLLA
jgi:hypothetical protein